MLEGDGAKGGVAVRGVVVEGALVGVGSGGLGDGYGVVGRVGVEDVDVVGPGDGGESCGEVALFVAGEDEDWRSSLRMLVGIFLFWCFLCFCWGFWEILVRRGGVFVDRVWWIAW
jgi:hypothetical protein